MIPEPIRLSDSDFRRSFELAPRVAVNLCLVRSGSVLLALRNIEPQSGCWHMPGSFLLKSERIEDCLARIAREEIRLVDLPRTTLHGVFENITGDVRGHVIDLVYVSDWAGTVPECGAGNDRLEFHAQLPEKIGFSQGSTIATLLS